MSVVFHEQPEFTLIRSDCVAAMKAMPDNSQDSMVCDPPYELGFMGKSWDGTGIANSVEMWREAMRVLKPGGHLVAFSGTRTYHRMACAIEDAGFQIRDQLAWVYGSGFPKSLDVSKALDRKAGAERPVVGFKTAGMGTGKSFGMLQSEGVNGSQEKVLAVTEAVTEAARRMDGWGTALKPAWEPICLARKPLDGTVAENVAKWGTGALNIDGCRIPAEKMVGYGGAPNLKSYGGFSNPNPNPARWPANLCHDGSDEVIAMFPDSEGQQGDLVGHSKDRLTKTCYGDMKAARDALARNDTGSAARFFYCAKGSAVDREEGCEDLPKAPASELVAREPDSPGLDSPRAGAGRTSEGRANVHPTVKPTELMRWLVRLVTPPGGRVLDAFNGSGSTGKACVLDGYHYTGIDKDNEGHYLPIAKARILYALQHKDRWEQIHAQPTQPEDIPGQQVMALL